MRRGHGIVFRQPRPQKEPQKCIMAMMAFKNIMMIKYYDDQIFDDSPCSFTNSDGVVVLKEIISYFDDSSGSVSERHHQEVISNMDNIPLGCLADDYNGVYFPDNLSPVSLNLSEKTNLGIGLPDLACGDKDSLEQEDQNDNMLGRPLYDGCPLTLEASLILQRTFAFSHNLTEAQLQEQLLTRTAVRNDRPSLSKAKHVCYFPF